MRLFTTLLFLLPCLLLFSQIPQDLVPRELFFKEKDKTHIHLSKDGEYVFYKKKEADGENIVFHVAVSSPLVERKNEFDGVVVDYLPTYDEGIFAVVKQDTNLIAQFTTTKSNKVRTLDFFPFSQLTMMQLSARFPNKILADVKAKDESQSGVYLLDLLSGSTKRMGQMDGFKQMLFDQNFSKVAALGSNELGGHTIYRYQGGKWEPVLEFPFNPDMLIGGLSRIISVSTDGTTIYATDNFEKDKTTLVSIDVESGQISELANDPDADIIPYGASIDATGKPTSAVALWGDTRRHFSDEKVRSDFVFLDKEIGNNGFVEASQDDKTWLVRSLDGGPATYSVFNRDEQKLTKLFNDYSYLNDYDLCTRKAHTITTRDGLKLPAHVYVPSGMAKADGTPKVPLPTIVYIHGGPWAGVTHWNSWYHTRNFQLLANRRHAVISMEFRGTTGLGKAICDAGNQQWGANMHNDIVDVVTWANRSGISNPRRVALWGWSYGGYATNFAMGAAPDLFSCGVSMYGICDLYEFTKLPFADNSLWRSRVGDPNTEEGAALLKEQSPSTYVKNINSPILLTTGSLDDRVPQSQVDHFANALNEAKKKVVYFYYPEEGHDYSQPESWVSFWAIAEDFLHRHTGGRKQNNDSDIEKGTFTIVYGADYIKGLE